MTDNTVHARVAGSQFGMHQRGEVIEVEEKTLSKHPRTLEKIDPEDIGEETESEEEETEGVDPEEVDPHPSDLKVGELEDRLEGVDDIATVETILELEKDGKDRSTAVTAIETRLNELEG